MKQWFSIDPPVVETSPRHHRPTHKKVTATQKQQLVAEVFIDGKPCFPDHYLFDHYRPELIEHLLSGPLYFHKRFFNQVELTTREKSVIKANSDLAAHALILSSHTGLERVKLPTDDVILADILSRYLDDLKDLKTRLIERCNELYENPSQSLSLARKIWRQQNLPPWETFEIAF